MPNNFNKPPLTREEILARIVAENEREALVAAIKASQIVRKDMCCCCLANAIYKLHLDLGMTWDEIADKVDGIGDKSLAHRIARRHRNVSKTTYNLATKAINKILVSANMAEIVFPSFPD